MRDASRLPRFSQRRRREAAVEEEPLAREARSAMVEDVEAVELDGVADQGQMMQPPGPETRIACDATPVAPWLSVTVRVIW